MFFRLIDYGLLQVLQNNYTGDHLVVHDATTTLEDRGPFVGIEEVDDNTHFSKGQGNEEEANSLFEDNLSHVSPNIVINEKT